MDEMLDKDMIAPVPGQISEDVCVIKVIGVGGAGTNAVNYMYQQGITNVDFLVCNTDLQSLKKSPVPNKIQLGAEGHGAGNKPEKGREAAEFSIEPIKEVLQNSTEMVFITAGMGGGTGTGAAPLIAKTAKDMGILTVGTISVPFQFEGRRRIMQAMAGVNEMRENVDALIVISTEKLKELYKDATLTDGFAMLDQVMTNAAKGIAEIVTKDGNVNVDLQDVITVMKDSGDAVMGIGIASGENRAKTAIEDAISCPLLLTPCIDNAHDILLNIACGKNDILVSEMEEITSYIESVCYNDDRQIIWGKSIDETLKDDELRITIVATGYNEKFINERLSEGWNRNGQKAPTTARPAQPHPTFQQQTPQPVQQPIQQPVYQQPIQQSFQQGQGYQQQPRPSQPTQPKNIRQQPNFQQPNFQQPQQPNPQFNYTAAPTEIDLKKQKEEQAKRLFDEFYNQSGSQKKMEQNGMEQRQMPTTPIFTPDEFDDEEDGSTNISNFDPFATGKNVSKTTINRNGNFDLNDDNGYLDNNVD